MTPPPVPLVHTMQRQQRLRSPLPQVQQQKAKQPEREREDTVRLQEPVSFFHDYELAYGFAPNEKPVASVRMGRGMISVRKVSAGTGEREKAERLRGRRTERAWS